MPSCRPRNAHCPTAPLHPGIPVCDKALMPACSRPRYRCGCLDPSFSAISNPSASLLHPGLVRGSPGQLPVYGCTGFLTWNILSPYDIVIAAVMAVVVCAEAITFPLWSVIQYKPPASSSSLAVHSIGYSP